ncbi:PhaM family polyhydroxyalkanoate granule multifunctional regulatory protein [Noviherbaspirillum sp. UKPF54]|uniref:PhaM family polyhydroxyalkanoate granule multifunctional regulatory protein n=1 Tax=Noviherbaspirillum sp. UKPF54 TaxID=2601898 RepID=UPI001AF01506|nr:PhaM family polyhydroxyalkanoate granule multifunctional regulatory protein [Noviherbaspirillum sp. UKPF54]
MIKPNMPNIPGIGAMTDTLEFVKNLWGGMGLPGMNMAGMSVPGMNVPGMVMPTLSVEEINKKITDLKAVESWLTLNMNMLRGTIQALEVQAATISTLQSMGESFSATMGAGMMDKAPAGGPSPSANGTNGSSGAAGGNGAGGSHAKSGGAPEPTSKDESDAATLTAPLVNAAAWWNMLQDQFKQAVNSAMATEEPATAAPEEKKQRPKAKTASATTSGTTRKRKTAK